MQLPFFILREKRGDLSVLPRALKIGEKSKLAFLNRNPSFFFFLLKIRASANLLQKEKMALILCHHVFAIYCSYCQII
jgi:hypothetical protein